MLISDLGDLIKTLSPECIFLVTGKNSYSITGAEKFIESSIRGYKYIRFSSFEENPKYEDVISGLSLFNLNNCDLVIAIGGGSVIDMAKLINIFSANHQIDYLTILKDNKLITNKGKTLVTIPTTAGTGSEATQFAVVYYNKVKYSVSHKFILPDIVGLNYNLTMTQPSYLAACSGLDALSQAIESFWSIRSTNESKKYAKEAILLLREFLEPNVLKPTVNSSNAVSFASYLAGKAINISKTTAPHAISYAFTMYFSIPHGHAVFLTLPFFLEYNSKVTEIDVVDSRGVDYVLNSMMSLCKLLGADSPKNAKNSIMQIAKNIGIELSLSKLLVNKSYDKTIISNNINIERLNNNPRKVNRKQINDILFKIDTID